MKMYGIQCKLKQIDNMTIFCKQLHDTVCQRIDNGGGVDYHIDLIYGSTQKNSKSNLIG